MTDPHLEPLTIEKRAETKYTQLYLTASVKTKDYALHIKVRTDHGLHETETLNADFFDFEASNDCPLNGSCDCFWRALGRKETVDAEAVIDAAFERFKKNIDRVLETTWDCRCAIRDLGYSLPDFLASA